MRPLKTESNNLLHLDALRLFAATAIVILHWSESIHSSTAVGPKPNIGFLSLAVDLFFLISGIVMHYVYFNRLHKVADYRQFLLRRVARIYPLHVATLVTMLLFFVVAKQCNMHVNHPNQFNYHAILPNLLLMQFYPFVDDMTFNDPAWSIAAEMLCYIFLPLGFYLFRKTPGLPMIISVTWIALLTICSHGWEWTKWTTFFGVARAIPAFLIGITLAGCPSILAVVPGPSLLFASTATLWIVLGLLDVSRGVLLVLVYLMGTFAFAADVQGKTSRLVSLVAPLGLLTYSIYMIQRPFQMISFRVFQLVLHPQVLTMNVYVYLSVVPLVFIAYLSYQYCETPLRRWISSLDDG